MGVEWGDLLTILEIFSNLDNLYVFKEQCTMKKTSVSGREGVTGTELALLM